jgi:hypothetical protein
VKFIFALVTAIALFTTPSLASAQAREQAVTPCLLTTTAATICKGSGQGVNTPGVLLGFVNNSATAQTATVTCYANASGAASGQVMATVPALSVNAVIVYPGGGRVFQQGLVCQASAAPTGAGIEVYVY